MAAVIKRKPTSPGRRFVVSIVDKDLHKGKPFAALTESKKRISGRNNRGKITVRHRGGGHKQRYRVIDFKRNKDDIGAKVAGIEYDPNRSARIALLVYSDGEKRYIIAPSKLSVGDILMSRNVLPFFRHQLNPVSSTARDLRTYSRGYADSQYRNATGKRCADRAQCWKRGSADGERRGVRYATSKYHLRSTSKGQ
jgi:ribosomal protein L2